MSYAIFHGNYPLSYWYGNNAFCGGLKDIIGYQWKSYFIFETKKEAEDKIKLMFKNYEDNLKILEKQKTEFQNKRLLESNIKLSVEILDHLKSLRVYKLGD